jgi:hypothetical protein
MHPLRLWLVATALLAACDEANQPLEPAAPGSTAPKIPSESPSFARAAQIGNGSGALVTRGTESVAFLVVDQERGLTTVIGPTLAEHTEACVTGQVPERVDFLEVIRPSGGIHLTERGKDIFVTVWSVATDDFCGLLLESPVLATGTAQVVATDNDFTVEAPGANSFGWRSTGTVITVTGGQQHYLAVFREIILPSGERLFPVEQIKLTPQGK